MRKLFPPLKPQNWKRKLKTVNSVCQSLFALLLEDLSFLAGQCEAHDEGKELLKVQQVIPVVIQVFQYLFRKFGVLLGLKESRHGTRLECNTFTNKSTVERYSQWLRYDWVSTGGSYRDKGRKLLLQKFLQLWLVQELSIAVFCPILLKNCHHGLQASFHFSHGCGFMC